MSKNSKFARFIGKVLQKQLVNKSNGEEFVKNSVLVDNPNPKQKDGSPNPYHKGILLWLDHETGKKYVVKQIDIAGVGDKAKEHGFVNSLKIELDNSYQVEEF